MKTAEELRTDLSVSPALRLLTAGKTPFFFDIETTGLSSLAGYIYLIGCLEETEGGFLFRQWFAENADEEPLILKAFSDALKPEHVMIDYNGTTFDLPFLRDRYRFHKLPCPLPDKSETVDLYRHLAPVKKLFETANRKQPTLELTAGYRRTDPYDGGTLIAFYSEYVARCRFDFPRAEELLGSLLLHNRDDIFGLSSLASLLPSCVLGELSLCEAAQEEEGTYVTFSAVLPYEVPKTLRKVVPIPEIPAECRLSGGVSEGTPAEADGAFGRGSAYASAASYEDGFFADVRVSGNRISVTVPRYDMTAYYYFSNYKDYYYLPMEDTAVHKSLASRVEKEYRRPATRETARQKKSGSFLPQLTERIGPVFRFRQGDELCFFENRPLDEKAITDYILDWFEFVTS